MSTEEGGRQRFHPMQRPRKGDRIDRRTFVPWPRRVCGPHAASARAGDAGRIGDLPGLVSAYVDAILAHRP